MLGHANSSYWRIPLGRNSLVGWNFADQAQLLHSKCMGALPDFAIRLSGSKRLRATLKQTDPRREGLLTQASRRNSDVLLRRRTKAAEAEILLELNQN
jgi:hypothetical protein